MTRGGVTIPGEHVARDGVTALPSASQVSHAIWRPQHAAPRWLYRGSWESGTGTPGGAPAWEIQTVLEGGWCKHPLTHLIKEKLKTFELDKFT